MERYAILTMKNETDMEKDKLERYGLKLVDIEETSPLMAMFHGIMPTEEVMSKLPMTCTLIVEGTKEQYLKYCKAPDSEVDSYWVV